MLPRIGDTGFLTHHLSKEKQRLVRPADKCVLVDIEQGVGDGNGRAPCYGLVKFAYRHHSWYAYLVDVPVGLPGEHIRIWVTPAEVEFDA